MTPRQLSNRVKKIAARPPPLSEPWKVQLRRPERERTDRALRCVVALGPSIPRSTAKIAPIFSSV